MEEIKSEMVVKWGRLLAERAMKKDDILLAALVNLAAGGDTPGIGEQDDF